MFRAFYILTFTIAAGIPGPFTATGLIGTSAALAGPLHDAVKDDDLARL